MAKRIEVEDLAETVGPTLDAFVSAAAPRLRKCAEAVYEELLYSVQDYLRENAEWNIGGEIERCRKIEAENRELRAQLEPLAGYNPAALAALVEAAEGVLPYLETMLVDDEADDESIGWEADEDGQHSKPIDFTMGQIRRLRTALTAIRAGEAS